MALSRATTIRCPFADVVTTTTHKTLRGPRGGVILCKKEFAEFVDKGCPLVIGGPLPHVMAAKAVAFKEANEPEFKDYAAKVCREFESNGPGDDRRRADDLHGWFG